MTVSSCRVIEPGTTAPLFGGFLHPLTPYYRKKAAAVARLPVHANPGCITYRNWPGLVVPSQDNLREPAQAIRKWQQERARSRGESRLAAFGYDMDNMKARAWAEGEMPLLRTDDETREWLERFVRQATGCADTVARLATGAVKSALYDDPKHASGDFGFIAEWFYRETEAEFFTALGHAESAIQNDPDSDDPTMEARQRWLSLMERAALRLFDEYASSDGLEHRAMHRHVKARFNLALALRGYGKAGKALYEGDSWYSRASRLANQESRTGGRMMAAPPVKQRRFDCT